MGVRWVSGLFHFGGKDGRFRITTENSPGEGRHQSDATGCPHRDQVPAQHFHLGKRKKLSLGAISEKAESVSETRSWGDQNIQKIIHGGRLSGEVKSSLP